MSSASFIIWQTTSEKSASSLRVHFFDDITQMIVITTNYQSLN